MMDDLPKNAKNAPGKKKGQGNFLLKLKPTEGKNGYRFRLLSFTTGTNTRDWPFIEKFVHEKWDKDAEGKGIYKGFVTCPTTRYTRSTLPAKANPYDLCPVCKYSNANFLTFKESNWKDKLSGKAVRDNKRKYIALVPVYVVKDPHEPTNIGKARVWVIKDKETYDELNAKIKRQQVKTKVFNGGEGVDMLVFIKKEEIVTNEGKPNEFKRTEVKIDQFGFGKQEYAIEAINEKFIEDFPFDEEFYTFSSQEELQKYYEDNVLSASNVPDDGIAADELAEDTPAVAAKTKPSETIEEEEESIVDQQAVINKDIEDIDSVIDSVVEEKPATKPKPKLNDKPVEKKQESLDNIDDLIDDVMKD